MDASMKKTLHLAGAALMIAPLAATTTNSLHMANANASKRNINAEAVAPHYSAKFNQQWRAFNHMNAKKYGHMSKRAYALRLYNEHLITDGIIQGTHGNKSVLFEPWLNSHLTAAQKAGIRAGVPVKGLSHEERTLLRKYGITNQHLAYLNFKNLNAKRTGDVRIPKSANLSAKTIDEIKNNKPVRGINARQQNVLVEFGIPVANGQRVLKTLGLYNEEAVSAPSYNQALKQTAKANAKMRQALKNKPKARKLTKAQRLDLAIDMYINKMKTGSDKVNHSSGNVAHAASAVGGRQFLKDVDYAYGHRHGWKRARNVKKYNAALAGVKQATHSPAKWVLNAPTEHQSEQRGLHLVAKVQSESGVKKGIDNELIKIPSFDEMESDANSSTFTPEDAQLVTYYQSKPKKKHSHKSNKSNTMRLSTTSGSNADNAAISSYVQSLNAKAVTASSQATNSAPANNATDNQQVQKVATDENDADKILIDTTQNGSMGEGYVDANTYANMLSQKDALARNGFTFDTDIENGRINGGPAIYWGDGTHTPDMTSLAVTTDQYGDMHDKQTDRVIGYEGSLDSFAVLNGSSLASLASAAPSTVASQAPTTPTDSQIVSNQSSIGDNAISEEASDEAAAMSAIGSDTTNSMDSVDNASQAPSSEISAESSVASSANSSTDNVWSELNSEDNSDFSAIGSDSTDISKPKSIEAPSSIAHNSSAVSSAASNIASQASSASSVVNHDDQSLDSSINNETKDVVNDAMRDAVNNTNLPSNEKSMVVSYFRDHSDAINNPNAVSSNTNSDVKNALNDYYKESHTEVPSSAQTNIKIEIRFNSQASSASKNGDSSVASSASSKASSASSKASSAISNYNANLSLGAPSSASSKPSNPTESQLNVEQLQALHDNNEALANAEQSVHNNIQNDQKISDVKTLHGRALRVPHVANGNFSLFTKPEHTVGAKQVISGKDLKSITNKDDSFAKTFMVFQTAKSSDGSTYYHVISYNAKYIGWINAKGMKRITLGKAKAEPKGQYTIQNRMLDTASGDKTSANHNEAPITDEGQTLNPAFVSAYSSIAQQLLDGNSDLAKAADVNKGDVDSTLLSMYTFSSTEKGKSSAKDKKAAKALQDYVQYKLNIPHYEVSSNQQARN